MVDLVERPLDANVGRRFHAAGFRASRVSARIKEWIAAGNDAESFRTEHGWTRLHLAAEYQDTEAVRYLIACGIHPDTRDNSGWSALHLAVDSELDESSQRNSRPNLRTVKELIRNGADSKATDSQARTPRDIAAGYGPDALAAYDNII
jgi:ankyrin repeat protein